MFDAKPAGFVCRQDQKYVAVGLRNNVIGDSKRFKIAKEYVGMNHAEKIGFEVKWNI